MDLKTKKLHNLKTAIEIYLGTPEHRSEML